jgi:hypothetical protein
MTARARWLLLVAALLPARLAAQAGPPYETDDPDPGAYRHWEFYLATADARTPGGTSGTAPHVEVNYTAAPNLFLHVLVPFAYATAPGGPSAYGLGDIEVGAKWRFVQEGRWRPMIGTFVQTDWPTASAASGLGTRHLHVLVPLWFQKSFGAWSTDFGGGYVLDFAEGYGNYWSGGWLVERQLSALATLGAEVFYEAAHHDGSPAALRANLGLVLNLTSHSHLLVSVGHSVFGERTLQAYFAYQLTLAPAGSEAP